jgi:hypothetical protein
MSVNISGIYYHFTTVLTKNKSNLMIFTGHFLNFLDHSNSELKLKAKAGGGPPKSKAKLVISGN